MEVRVSETGMVVVGGRVVVAPPDFITGRSMRVYGHTATACERCERPTRHTVLISF
jgi:hypothetical protein